MSDFTPDLIKIAGGFAVGYSAHWFTRRRERAKEFNTLTNRLFIQLRKEGLGEGLAGITAEWCLVELHIPWYRRRGFRRAVKRYEESQENLCAYDAKSGTATLNESRVLAFRKSSLRLSGYLKPR